MMRKVVFGSIVSLLVSLFLVGGANAIPNFAREYDADCTTCHTTVPKLNKTGYEFRRAGFRLPSDIGQEENDFDLADKFAARIQTKFKYTGTSNAGVTSTSSQLNFHEVTVYPISGSYGKNWSSLVEMSFAPEESVEIENAYVRYDFGDEDRFTHVRWGIMHPFEGFGASDRPVSLSRPLFQTETVNNFKIWGLDQAGAEIGTGWGDTTITGTIFNGVNEAGKAALGGGQVKGSGALAQNNKDLQVVFNKMIGNGGAAVSAIVYSGALGVGTTETNTFTRTSVYGNLPLANNFEVLGGIESGSDNLSVTGQQNNSGYFAEIDWTPVSGNVGAANVTTAVRYDLFDPNTGSANNEKSAVTLALNTPFNNGFQLITELKRKITEQSTGERHDNTFEIRGISIF